MEAGSEHNHPLYIAGFPPLRKAERAACQHIAKITIPLCPLSLHHIPSGWHMEGTQQVQMHACMTA